MWVAEPLATSLLGLRETRFSQHPGDRPWEPFLEAIRAPEVSQSLLERE